MQETLSHKLSKIRNLEANIKASKQILRREEARIEELQKECSHDIVIVADVPSPGYIIKAKCLFCGQHYDSPHSLRELPDSSILLEACDSKKLQNHSEDDIYDFFSTQAQIATLSNSNMSKKELGKDLKKLL